MFAQASDSADRNNPFDAQALECPDIGTYRYFGRRDAMPTAMARKKGHGTTLDFANRDNIARVAKGRLYCALFDVGHTLHMVESATADHTNGCMWHKESLL